MITKRIISFFTFGVILLLIGIVLNFIGNTQANLIMAIGLVFELLALLLFLWNKLRK